MEFEREIKTLLRRLGANGSYLGFKYAVYGIQKTIENPDCILVISKDLYVDISFHYKTTIKSVERNIRTIRELIWDYGDRELLDEIFCRKLDKCPGNAAFLDGLAQYVIDNYIS